MGTNNNNSFIYNPLEKLVASQDLYLDEYGKMYKRKINSTKVEEGLHDKRFREWADQISDLSKKRLDLFIDESEKNIQLHKNSLERVVEEIKKNIDINVNRPQIKLVEVLGFFVGIFTFVSVEFQVLRNVTSFLSAAGLTLILLGGIFTMMMLIGFWVRDYAFSKKWLLLVFPLLLCAGGIWLVWNEEKSPDSILGIENRIEILEKENMKLHSAIRAMSAPKSVDCRALDSL